MSPRLNALRTLTRLCREVANGRYYVRRGPVNHVAFDYVSRPWVMSILVPEFDLLQAHASSIVSGTMVVTLEMTTRIKPEAQAATKPAIDGLDDEVFDTLCEDAETILDRFTQETNDQGDPVVLQLPRNDIKGQQIVNHDWSVQGIQVSFAMEY